MIKVLEDKLEFKAENLSNWINNTDYWIHSSLRQVEDTNSFLKKKLKEILFDGCLIYDMGCGSGWLINLLFESDFNFKYVGFDFNKNFVSYLQKKFNDKPNVEIVYADLENPLSKKYLGKADFIFSNFSFFEIADLSAAFNNTISGLSYNGNLIISTIDLTYLIIAISNNYQELKNNLTSYEKIKALGKIPYFFQPIDMGNEVSSELKYGSVLYSFSDYFNLAKSNGLTLFDFDEIICTSKFIPKIYQYMHFRK